MSPGTEPPGLRSFCRGVCCGNQSWCRSRPQWWAAAVQTWPRMASSSRGLATVAAEISLSIVAGTWKKLWEWMNYLRRLQSCCGPRSRSWCAALLSWPTTACSPQAQPSLSPSLRTPVTVHLPLNAHCHCPWARPDTGIWCNYLHGNC